MVEHNLAKVGVEGSNPFTRSNFQYKEVNKLRTYVRDLARILRAPDWTFVATNVTVRAKWLPFVNAVNPGKHK